MTSLQIIALIIFIITYTGIIFTRLPGINIDRPSAAFFGAVAMILTGIVSFDDAIASIDFNTIALLLGMMIIIASIQSDGFFDWLTQKTIRVASNSRGLLTALVLITGIGSAFLVNDAVVLIVTPITISICIACGLQPVPYLIGVILASNAGSVMTMTGNPQNMLIGITSGMSYGKFFLHLLPVSILSMAVVICLVRLAFPSEFRSSKILKMTPSEEGLQYKSMRVSIPVFIAVLILFFLSSFFNISIPMIALAGASVILIFGKARPSEIIRKVDWVLLLFFAGLFIVVHAIEEAGLLEQLKSIDISAVGWKTNFLLHATGLIVSQIISNVPYVIAMLPVVKQFESDALWLILASSSTIAGNATIIGAVANIIVIETAAKHHVKITFRTFLLPGILSTLICILFSVVLIQLQIIFGWI
jgi:Na+/H+ antiporter NhaD/arsenite permease-like protein